MKHKNSRHNVRLQVITDNIICVSATPDKNFSDTKSLITAD